MRTIEASEFQARCLALMDEIAQTNETIVITKNGHPVSKLVPYREKLSSLFGLHVGQLEIHGNIVTGSADDWEATR